MEIVLNSYGAKLSINNGAFMLNNSTGSHRIPVKDVDSILVAKSAVLTSDALILAIENDIRVTLADKGGNVMGCVWSHKYGSISTIRKGQLIFTSSQDAVEWIKKVIIQKMQNQLAMLLMLQYRKERTHRTGSWQQNQQTHRKGRCTRRIHGKRNRQ